MLRPRRIAAPAETPVSLAEAKAHLRVDHDDDDGPIEVMIQAATDHLDGWSGILGRCLVSQTWRASWPWPEGMVRLPMPDASGLQVRYHGPDGAVVVLDDWYALRETHRGPVATLRAGLALPRVVDGHDVEADAVYGFGAPADVPAALRHAILLHVGTLYAHRETVAEKAAPTGAYEALVAPYRWACA